MLVCRVSGARGLRPLRRTRRGKDGALEYEQFCCRVDFPGGGGAEPGAALAGGGLSIAFGAEDDIRHSAVFDLDPYMGGKAKQVRITIGTCAPPPTRAASLYFDQSRAATAAPEMTAVLGEAAVSILLSPEETHQYGTPFTAWLGLSVPAWQPTL